MGAKDSKTKSLEYDPKCW